MEKQELMVQVSDLLEELQDVDFNLAPRVALGERV